MKYVCPVHPEVVLYQGERGGDGPVMLQLITFDSLNSDDDEPSFCQECEKSYYRWECERKADE